MEKNNQYYQDMPEFRKFCEELHSLPYNTGGQRHFYHNKLCSHFDKIGIQKEHSLGRYFTKEDKDISKWILLSAIKYICAVNQMEELYKKRIKLNKEKNGFTIDTIAFYPEFNK